MGWWLWAVIKKKGGKKWHVLIYFQINWWLSVVIPCNWLFWHWIECLETQSHCVSTVCVSVRGWIGLKRSAGPSRCCTWIIESFSSISHQQSVKTETAPSSYPTDLHPCLNLCCTNIQNESELLVVLRWKPEPFWTSLILLWAWTNPSCKSMRRIAADSKHLLFLHPWKCASWIRFD